MTTTREGGADYYEARGHEALRSNRDAPAFWHDERIGETHALVILGPDGDALAESNVDTIIDDILSDYTDDGDVEVGTVGGAFGRHVGITVRVFTDDGAVAPSWRAFLDDVIDPLEQYPVLDEGRYSEYEHAALVEYVGSELGGDDHWTDAVLEAVGVAGDDLETIDLEDYVHHVYTQKAQDVLHRFEEWERLRTAGTGQLTTDGDTVVVPEPPAAAEVAALLADVGDLPWVVERVAEGTEDHAALEVAYATLAGVAA